MTGETANDDDVWELVHNLQYGYHTLVATHCDSGTKLTREALNETIPGRLFELAIILNWIPYFDDDGDPDPAREGDAVLSGWSVTKELKDAFLRVLPIHDYKASESEASATPRKRWRTWRKPTPITTITEFCERNTTPTVLMRPTGNFVKVIAGQRLNMLKDRPDSTVLKRIQRLIDPKLHPETAVRIPLPSERDFAEQMKEKMVAYDPRSASMDIMDLMWVPAENERVE